MRRIAVVCVAVLAAFAVFATAGQNANSATYSKVIDNSDKERFAASKSWKKSDEGKGINGRDYLRAEPAKKGGHALFEVAIPTNGVYAVYVRWPEMRGLNDRTPVGVESAYGTKWTEVDQRKNGGRWVRLGEFEMRKNEKFPIRISHNTKGKGKIAADAVKVEMISSYEQSAGATRAESATPSEGTRTASATGSSVVTKARSYLNIRYWYATCTTTLMSCTCLTKKNLRCVRPYVAHDRVRTVLIHHKVWNCGRKNQSASRRHRVLQGDRRAHNPRRYLLGHKQVHRTADNHPCFQLLRQGGRKRDEVDPRLRGCEKATAPVGAAPPTNRRHTSFWPPVAKAALGCRF